MRNLGNRYTIIAQRSGSKGPRIGNGMGYQMVRWPMTSRDPERSNKLVNPNALNAISGEQIEMLFRNNH